jgi:L-lactate dehydrogenase (cytochrome)
MRLTDCHNVADFRRLAKARLPSPIFDYIDGAADDEVTKGRNSSAFDDCDLVPNVLAGTDGVDMAVTVMGQTVAMPLMLSPTALQRLFHWQGERAVAATAQHHNMCGSVSPASQQ